jgi:NAD(P)-dependent dehydrogenase (short-subunit alcohol dehydrogenase family)
MTPMGIRLTLGENPTADEIEGMKKLRREQNPLNRLGDAWDVAEAVAFIASEKARWITGVVLVVDGGRMLSAAIA